MCFIYSDTGENDEDEKADESDGESEPGAAVTTGIAGTAVGGGSKRKLDELSP